MTPEQAVQRLIDDAEMEAWRLVMDAEAHPNINAKDWRLRASVLRNSARAAKDALPALSKPEAVLQKTKKQAVSPSQKHMRGNG